MLVFPQISTGASALYPLTKTTQQRSVVNTLGDGHIVVYADAAGASLGWELHATGLTSGEWAAIEALFEATSGMWQSFTFLDPVGNLLSSSEDFGASVWTNGPLITLTIGVTDPFGTTRAMAVANAGEGVQAVEQTLAVPGTFQYCLSVWARTDSGTNVTLTIATTGGSATKISILSMQWTRIFLSANLAQSTDSVTFSVEVPAAGSIDLFGMQVEAQRGPSDYKSTGASSGVYPNARFGADRITVTAQGTDDYDAVMQIVNMEN